MIMNVNDGFEVSFPSEKNFLQNFFYERLTHVSA